MDEYNRKHLEHWLDRVCYDEEERDALRAKILALVASDPDLLKDHSWPELRDLTERIAEQDKRDFRDLFNIAFPRR